jgi:UDP-N-acetylglucosamine acyltransferase
VSVRVHPTAIVGDGVHLDEGVSVGPYAVLLGPAWLHQGVQIGPAAVIGPPPEVSGLEQNLAWAGELAHGGVEIGPRTVVREMATVHQGTVGRTVVGADCWVLNRVYVAHDGQVADGVTLSSGASLGGHVRVGAGGNVGMAATVHQGRCIGPGAMVGMGSSVTRDVPPYALVYGNPARLHGVNATVLRHSGVAGQDMAQLASLYEEGMLVLSRVPLGLRAVLQAWADLSPAKPLLRLVP